MKQQINEIERMQFLAGILTEAPVGMNMISNPIIKKPTTAAPAPSTSKTSEGDYKLQLKIDGKVVMETSADSNPSPEELSNTLFALESKYRSKYNFEKAEIVVLDPSGKQVGSVTKRNNFLDKKATSMGMGYTDFHGTV
jgi:hypothetical protein